MVYRIQIYIFLFVNLIYYILYTVITFIIPQICEDSFELDIYADRLAVRYSSSNFIINTLSSSRVVMKLNKKIH